MSNEAPNWYVEKYKSEVIFKLQSGSHVLKGTYMPPSRIDGKKLYFPIAGEGEATEMKRGADLVPMNAGREMKELTTKPYQAAEYIYHEDLSKMTANENAVAQKQCADALGRKVDEIVLVNTVHAGKGTYGTVYGASNAAWDLSKALNAATAHFDKYCPEDGRNFCMLPQKAYSQMLTYEEFNSADWNGGDLPLVKTRRGKSWAGIHWFPGPAKLFDKMTATDAVSFYIWHFSAIGAGYNAEEMNTRITWENPKTAWLSNNWIDSGATVLLPEGITECVYDKSTAIAFA